MMYDSKIKIKRLITSSNIALYNISSIDWMSLFERLGGETAVSAVVDKFY
jgi:hypothetical protein